ncbi:MAG TPA: HEAT repeat domain-containing protein [Terriglobia bacterium]|nr:HEAT repeat domain-containing protein [Terriglobia bacterium]
MNCHDFEQSIPLYVYNELSGAERTALEEHVVSCEACRKALEQSQKLVSLLTEAPLAKPTPNLLVVCRQRLEDALDREQLGWRALVRAWLPPAAMAHPARAITGLTLVAFGFSLGWLLRPRITARVAPSLDASPSSMVGGDLRGARINSISQVAPDPQTGQVRITLNAEKRVTMEGSLDDPHIRQVLVYAVKSYDNPGIRLDTLSALRKSGSDPAVRDALLYALVHDNNAGVRLEALRSLGKANWNADVAQAFLEAAEKDNNLGMREAAIDGLVAHISAQGDEDLVPALQRLAQEDSDRYVRIKSLGALRQMGQPPY